MKKNLLIALLTITISAQSQITIPNASFENWTTGTFFNPDVPTGWKSYSVSSGAGKITDAHTGTYALKLKIKLNSSVPDISAGFNFPSGFAPKYYSYWAKVHLSGSDKFYINADILSKTANYTIASIPYSEEYTFVSQNTNVWSLFTYTLQGAFTTPSDSMHLRFTFTTGVDTASYVIVDDIAFTNAPVGINELRAGSLIQSVYPNPANSVAQLIYTVTQAADVKLAVYDVIGNKVADVVNMSQGAGTYKADIDVHDFARGIYYLHLTVGGQHYVQKLSVNH